MYHPTTRQHQMRFWVEESVTDPRVGFQWISDDIPLLEQIKLPIISLRSIFCRILWVSVHAVEIICLPSSCLIPAKLSIQSTDLWASIVKIHPISYGVSKESYILIMDTLPSQDKRYSSKRSLSTNEEWKRIKKFYPINQDNFIFFSYCIKQAFSWRWLKQRWLF